VRRRKRRHDEPNAKVITFYDLELGDVLLDDDGQLYLVTELTEPEYWKLMDESITRFKMVGLVNTNCMSGNARPRSEVGTFDYRTWIWHSREGCLIL
jgi:hypothetical protein